MRTTIEMCEGWRFWRSAEAEGEGEAVSVPHDAMLGEGRDANAPSGGAGAYFEGGVYRYEREIVAPEGWRDACVTLEFEGVYRNASVYLNGEKIAFNAYGYSGFYVCLDGALRYGEKNVLAVVADNSKVPNSRWYSGSGIYRPVRLVVRPLRRIDLDGIAVRTVSIDPTGAEAAHVMVDVTHNAGEGAAVLVDIVRDGAQVASAASGLGNTRPSASADERWVSSVEVAIPDARLWSAEAPNLYECRIRLVEGDAAFDGDAVADVTPLDEDCVTFGIRTLEWGPRGLLVNGRETKLAGGCIHHDNGILGAIDLDVASYRKIRIMKEWGYNAVRSAHNPMSKGMLRACDELGMYVMDELCDMWYENKNPFDYALDFEESHEADARAMVAKDVNHPCVVMYSIGNENAEPAEERGVECARRLVDLFHRLDPTRPATAGANLMIIYMATRGIGVFNADGEGTEGFMANAVDAVAGGGADADAGDGADGRRATGGAEADGRRATGSLLYNTMVSKIGAGMDAFSRTPMVGAACEPYLAELDICGYNYAAGRYARDLARHPDRVIFGSETMPYDVARNWAQVKANPRLVGDFMWTAWDYLGEVGVGGWSDDPADSDFSKPYPWLLNGGGAIDLIGFPTGEAAMARVAFAEEVRPLVFVRPVSPRRFIRAPWRGTNSVESWSWAGHAGERTVVEVYTAAPIARLYVNGRHVATKRVHDCHADFDVRYEPGEVMAVACEKNGLEVARSVLRSAASDLRLVLRAEDARDDVVFVVASIEDEAGVVESAADRELFATVEGGELLAFGSAVNKSEGSYLSGTFPTHFGRALACVRRGDGPGACMLRVSSRDAQDGLSAEIEL